MIDEPWAYLNGLDYPAMKLDVIAIAEANGAPQDTLELLQALELEQFPTAKALNAAFGMDEALDDAGEVRG